MKAAVSASAGTRPAATDFSLANGSGLASNYSLATGQIVAASITPAALTIGGLTAANKVYDGNSSAAVNTNAVKRAST